MSLYVRYGLKTSIKIQLNMIEYIVLISM